MRQDTARKKTPEKFYSAAECEKMAVFVRNADGWKKCSEQLLKSWKHNGVPPADFLALARFRKERYNRIANLKGTKSKRKRREQQRNG